MEISVETITPEIATDLLENKNANNRIMKPRTIKQYARDMKNDKWQLTGEPIQLDAEGNLLNGQHRLAAIKEAGRPIQIVVARGVNPEAIIAMDQGVKRKFADQLKMDGHKCSSRLAAAIKGCYKYENGLMKTNEAQSNAELMEWFRNNPRIVDSVSRLVQTNRNSLMFNGQGYTMLDYLTSKHLPGEFQAFAGLIIAEATPPEGTPAFVYRRFIDNERMIHGRKVSYLYLQAVAVKAWNAHILGEKISRLVWYPGGLKQENFPTIVTRMP